MKTKRLGYSRVSSKSASLDLQLEALEKAGCDQIFSEKISGKNRKRPQLEKLLNLMDSNTTIICTKCDRLGRSVLDLCQIAKEIEEAGADLVFLEQGIDTSNPTGKMMFQILAVVSEFERSLITGRMMDAKRAAMEKGKKMGRKIKTSAIQDEQMVKMYQERVPWNDIAETFGVTRQTVYRRIKHLIDDSKLAN